MKKIIIAAMSALALLGTVSCGSGSDNRADQHKIAIVAHRGYWNCDEGGYARNSIAALRAAQEYGFWGIEFDLNMTSDEVILVVHDSVLEGKRIDQNPYSEFEGMRLENGEKIPTLDEFLAQGCKSPKTVLVCEFKRHSTPELEDRLMELAFAKFEEYGVNDPERIVFVSFSRHVCDRIANEKPGFTIEYLNNDCDPDNLAATNINGVNYEYHTFWDNPTWYDMARSHDMNVKAWCINDPDDMGKIAELGVDVIATDTPDVLRTVLKDAGIKEK